MQRIMQSSGIERMIKNEQLYHIKNSEKRILARKNLQRRLKSQDLARKLKSILVRKVRYDDAVLIVLSLCITCFRYLADCTFVKYMLLVNIEGPGDFDFGIYIAARLLIYMFTSLDLFNLLFLFNGGNRLTHLHESIQTPCSIELSANHFMNIRMKLESMIFKDILTC